MKTKILFLIVILLPTAGICNSEIDGRSKSVPDSLQTIEEISTYLSENLYSDKDKTRAFYVWIAHNIKYDLKQKNIVRRYFSKSEIIDEALENRQGICQHYSEIFHAMCVVQQIKSYVIRGYARNTDGKIINLSHVWNAILIDSKYYNIDVTWAAGYEQNDRFIHKFCDEYFLIEPKIFVKTHIPFDPIWQFLENPINHQDFYNQDFSKIEQSGSFEYKDSITKHEQLDVVAALEQSNKRIIQSGIINELIKIQIDENYFQIENTKYNIAIDTLNYGIDIYNLYISYKNKQFLKTKLPDSTLKKMISDIETSIYAADKMFQTLVSNNKDLNKLISDSRKRMPKLISNMEREKDFVEKYLNSSKPKRMFMFIKKT